MGQRAMELRRLGWTEERVPVIGQGTWQMERDQRDRAIQALRTGIDEGLTHIDTAEMYGSGAVESLVGEAIGGRRDSVFLVSKVLPQNASRKGTVAACERSLRRLGTDRIDLYLLHWPGDHPLDETIAGFEQLVQDGKIRFFGVSNFDRREMEEAVRIAGPRRIACNQVLYHLEERRIEHEVVPWCVKHDIAVVGYSPFGSGAFPTRGSAEILREIAGERGASERQVALRFLVREPLVLAIPKSSRSDHVRDNAQAGRWSLSPAEAARVDGAFPVGRRVAGIPFL